MPPRDASLRAPEAAVLLDVLPLPGGAVLSVLRAGPEILVSPLVEEHVAVRRAVPGDGAFAGIWAAIRAGGRAGRFTAWPSDGAPDALQPRERVIDVDQSNDSVVVGESVVVKLYPRTAPGLQPGLELPAHLAAAGFVAMPSPLGALTWSLEDGRDAILVTAAGFLPGARDGWDWYLSLVLGWLDGTAGDAEAFAPASDCGALMGALHAGLATPTSVMPDPLGTAGEGVVLAWRTRALSLLAEALEVTGGAEGARLRAREGAIRESLATIDVAQTPTMRIHGDLHVGQMLAWDGGLAVADFDGDPVAPADVRLAPDAPTRDVAAFVRSIDHLGRVAQERRPGRETDVEAWIARSRGEVLRSYREALAAAGCSALFDPRLLRPFEVAQELHEFVYAARFLPRWRSVPDLALRAMFPQGDA
jgi:maltokinase